MTTTDHQPLTPEEIREKAVEIILDHARDVEFMSICEMLPDGLTPEQIDEAATKIDSLIALATITVKLPGAEPEAAEAEVEELRADRDRAREIAVALEQEQANAWIVPKVPLDDNPYVRPRILGNGLIRRDSGDSTPEHTRQFVAQCLAAADEAETQAKSDEEPST